MARARKSKGDVQWYLTKNSKKPFAHSTVATSDLIVMLSEDYETIQEVYDNINFDDEAKEILKVFIENGYGNEIARNYFK